MLIVNEINTLLHQHLTKEFGNKFTKKYFIQFQRFFSTHLLKASADKFRRTKYNNYLKELKYDYTLLKDDEFLISYKKIRGQYSRITGSYINKPGRVRLLNIMINVFENLKILKLSRESQIPIDDDPKVKIKFSTYRYWKLKLPKKCTFEYTEPVEFNDSIYNIDHTEVMRLQYNNDYKDFIKYFFQYLYAAKNGYRVLNDEISDGTGPRLYHTFTNLSKPVREIITINGQKTESIDIRSSHLLWLANLTGSEKLYQDIENGEIKKKFKKKSLLVWLNNKNYNAFYYKHYNVIFLNDYGIDTFDIRTGKTASLYEPLATMESDYLIKGISNKLDVPHFTIHDQIYYAQSSKVKIDKLINSLSGDYKFEPIWD